MKDPGPAAADPLAVTLPDYDGGSIVNLMESIARRFGAAPGGYAPATLLDEARLAEVERIALVVIDGLGAELCGRIGRGAALDRHRAGILTSVYPPTTASAVTTFMSGLAPQQHGLTGWFMHFRKLGAVTAVLPFMPRYGREPLGRGGVLPADLIDAPSFATRIDAPAAALLPADLAESAFSQLLAAGAARTGYRGLDDFAARLARFCRGGDEAAFLYAYWPQLDYLAHVHGPSSAAVADHFAALDRALAPIVDAAAGSGTLVIVTADHGFIDTTTADRIDLEDHPALADMLTLPLCGEPRTAYAYVRAGAAAEFEACLDETLADAIDWHRAEDAVAAGWFGRGAPHPELTARLGDYVLCLRGRRTLRDRVVGERDLHLAGVHGGQAAAEQLVPLFLSGP
ncbi:MAG: alkaline phosphatase family protein [Gammaproteobacteria bacterium]